MLIFFDETFRESLRYPDVSLGALCGIAIPEKSLARIASDIYQLKLKHFGADFAREGEIKGKELFKNWVFKLAAKGTQSKNLAFGRDILDYINGKRLTVFGCVCFEKGFQKFEVEDVTALDKTFKYIFERIDMFMKIHHPDEKALLVFDDRDLSYQSKKLARYHQFLSAKRSWAVDGFDSSDAILRNITIAKCRPSIG